jgi:hypothetical protein
MKYRSALRSLSVAVGSVILAGCGASRDAADSEALGSMSEAEITDAGSEHGRVLDAAFCTHFVDASPFPIGLCIELKFGDQTVQGFFDSPGQISLRPGNYWLKVKDTSSAHNFSLTGPDGLDVDFTTVPEGSPTNPVERTFKIQLKHGSYTLLCDADEHAANGMRIAIDVGGVGQVD